MLTLPFPPYFPIFPSSGLAFLCIRILRVSVCRISGGASHGMGEGAIRVSFLTHCFSVGSIYTVHREEVTAYGLR